MSDFRPYHDPQNKFRLAKGKRKCYKVAGGRDAGCCNEGASCRKISSDDDDSDVREFIEDIDSADNNIPSTSGATNEGKNANPLKSFKEEIHRDFVWGGDDEDHTVERITRSDS